MSNIDTIAYSRQSKIFSCSNVSGKVLTVVGTAMTGLIMWNPVGSKKKLILLDAGWVWTTVSGSVHTVGIAIGPSTTTLPSSTTVGSAVIQCADGSNTASVAKAWDIATIGVACVATRWMGGTNWITGGTGIFPYSIVDKIDGAVSVVPGASVAFCMIGTGPVGTGQFTYIEVDA